MFSKFALPAVLTTGLMFGAAAAQSTTTSLGVQVKPCEVLTTGLTAMLGNIEAKLALTAKQKPLYAQWQNVVLTTARRHEPVCAKTPEDLPLMERIAWEQQRHLNRAEALNAEMPALIALRDSLSDKQRVSFDAAVVEQRFAKSKTGFVVNVVPSEPSSAEVLSGVVTTTTVISTD